MRQAEGGQDPGLDAASGPDEEDLRRRIARERLLGDGHAREEVAACASTRDEETHCPGHRAGTCAPGQEVPGMGSVVPVAGVGVPRPPMIPASYALARGSLLGPA